MRMLRFRIVKISIFVIFLPIQTVRNHHWMIQKKEMLGRKIPALDVRGFLLNAGVSILRMNVSGIDNAYGNRSMQKDIQILWNMHF